MIYKIDEQNRIWFNGGVVVEGCGEPYDAYLAWLAEGNTPEPWNPEEII